MAKYNCPYCDEGYIHTSVEIPNRSEWLLMSDEEYENIKGQVDSDDLYQKFKSLFICHNCGSLAIFWKDFETDPIWYQK